MSKDLTPSARSFLGRFAGLFWQGLPWAGAWPAPVLFAGCDLAVALPLLVEQTVPGIKQIYDSQGVDLVFLFPFCPACHRSTAVIARALEARGLPTLSMNVLWEAGQEMKPPRTCFLDFPLGCPAGKPHESVQQREIRFSRQDPVRPAG